MPLVTDDASDYLDYIEQTRNKKMKVYRVMPDYNSPNIYYVEYAEKEGDAIGRIQGTAAIVYDIDTAKEIVNYLNEREHTLSSY